MASVNGRADPFDVSWVEVEDRDTPSARVGPSARRTRDAPSTHATATQALGYLIALVINLALVAVVVAFAHTEPAPITRGCTQEIVLPTRSN